MDNNMLPETVAGAPTQRKRRRPALSCAECRRKKIKCDRNIPCGPCTLSKSTTCTYSPEGLSARKNHVPTTGTPSSKPASASVNVPHDPTTLTGHMQSTLVEGCFSPSPYRHSNESENSPARESTSSSQNSHPQNVEGLVARVQKLESLLASASLDEPGSTTLSKLPARDLRGNYSKTRWFGQSHWMQAFAQARKVMCFEFSDGAGDISLKDKEADQELNTLVEKCKIMSKAIKASQAPQWTLWGTTFKHTIPPRDVAERLIKGYLRTHESNYRILHIPSFRKEYTQVLDSPQTASLSSTIKVLLTMAIGVCVYQCPDAEFEELRGHAIQWIYAAQSWLASPGEKKRLYTSVMQIQCLLVMARAQHNITGDLVWINLGSIVRAAIQMGFHRDPRYIPRIPVLHAEIRRRLWATILELNLQSSLDSGMSPLISIGDYDTEPPANLNDEDITETMLTRPESKPSNVFTQTSIQLAMISSFATRLEICRLINDFRFEPSYDEILRLSAIITKAFKISHNFFAQATQTSTKYQGKKVPPLQRKLLDLIIQRFLLALHRPFALKARIDPRYYYSHKIYVESALSIMSHPDPDSRVGSPVAGDVPEDDYTRLRLVSGGFLKEVIIHAAVVIYLEMILPLEDDPAPHACWGENGIYRTSVRKLIEETIAMAERRIQLGETNIKGHLVFSIALGHINAIEEGRNSEEGIIQAAKSSLNYSMQALEKRMPKPQENILEESMGLGGDFGSIGTQDLDFAMQDWGMELDGTPGANSLGLSTDAWLFPAWANETSW